jgi:hypothetical protein
MSNYDEIRLRLQLKTTPEVDYACRTLESRGLSFCIHFGTENASDLLADMNRAFDLGVLYEWMRNRCGVSA